MPIFGTVSSGTPLGFKNLIINGNFDVWQRATSTTYNNTTGYPAADRWLGTTNGGVNVVYSQQANGFDQNGKANSCRVQRASGSSGRFYLTQMMETSVLNFCRGKTVTLSYWAKRGSDFGATDLVVRIATQTDQTPREDGAVQNTDNTPSLTTSWQKFSHTFTLTSTSDSASGFKVEFIAERAGGTNVWYEVAQVQLEIGNVATTFETRPYGTEFLLCQRYCQKIGGGTNFHALAMWNVTTTSMSNLIIYPVTMRSSPTAIISGTPINTSGGSVGTDKWALYNNGGWIGCVLILISNLGTTTMRIDAEPNNSGTGGGASGLYGGTSCFWLLSAEL
jgi:hypothetical protein